MSRRTHTFTLPTFRSPSRSHTAAGSRFRRITTLLAGALAALAAIAAVSALASSSSPSFETGLEPFTNTECAHPATQFTRVTSPVREGSYAARISETAADVWSGNNIVRCLLSNYNTGETTGSDYYYHVSMFIPSQGLSNNLIWELHHPSSLYSISPGCSVAPHAILSNGSKLYYRLRAGNCTGNAYALQTTMDLLNPIPTNVWIDFVIHIRFQESNTGAVQVWYRTGNNPWPTSPQVDKQNVPTMPYSDANNVHNVKLYWELGLYAGYTGYSGSDYIYLDDYRRETSLGTAEGTTSTTSTPPPPSVTTYTYTSSIAGGAKLTGNESWTVSTSNPTASKVEFYADGNLLGSQPVSGGKASYQLNLPASSTNGSYSIYDSSGTLLYKSATISWTVTPPAPTPVSYSYTSSIASGAKLTGREIWTITTNNPAASKVEFYADNKLISTQPVSGGKASYQLNLPATSTSGGYHVYDKNGALLYRSPSIIWTVAR